MTDSSPPFIKVNEFRHAPLSPVLPEILRGSKASDFGFLTKITSHEADVIRGTDLGAARFLRPMLGQKELLTNKERWCLWLTDAFQDDIGDSALLSQRIDAVKSSRLNSPIQRIQKLANEPHQYEEVVQPDKDYLAVPLQPSGRYEHIPVDIVSADFITSHTIGVIASNKRLAMGVLSSYAFKVWKRNISKSSTATEHFPADHAYNAFPLPALSQSEIGVLEEGARGISTARAYLGVGNLDEMYDPRFKEPQLKDAHTELNENFYQILNLPPHPGEEKIMERLTELYRELARA